MAPCRFWLNFRRFGYPYGFHHQDQVTTMTIAIGHLRVYRNGPYCSLFPLKMEMTRTRRLYKYILHYPEMGSAFIMLHSGKMCVVALKFTCRPTYVKNARHDMVCICNRLCIEIQLSQTELLPTSVTHVYRSRCQYHRYVFQHNSFYKHVDHTDRDKNCEFYKCSLGKITLTLQYLKILTSQIPYLLIM
jgi:hypothetical protein